MLVCLALMACLCFFWLGCSNIRGFQHADDGVLSPYAARHAADIARAEADVLDRIADRDSEAASGVVDAATSLADSLGAPAAVGGVLGALATLWIPPPGTRRKKKSTQWTSAKSAQAGTC